MATKLNAVLLIDDNEIDNLINQKMLQSLDFCNFSYTCSNARSAVEFLKNLQAIPENENVLPDLIFLDLDMPIMDGFQFLGQFEKLSDKIKTKTKIAMLSSSREPMDLNNALNNKYVLDFYHKPMSEEIVLRILDRMNVKS